MNIRKACGFRRGVGALILAAQASGCAASASASGAALGVTMAQGDNSESVRIATVRVVDDQVNPLAAVQLTSDGNAVAVRFAPSRGTGAIALLDAETLALVARQPTPANRAVAPPTGVARVAFPNGRFIECWKGGDSDHGYRVMVQAWTPAGAPRGRPVPISPVDADVLGAPQVVAVDRESAVVTFTAAQDDRFELLAVRLEVF